jgi:hypothetical protein
MVATLHGEHDGDRGFSRQAFEVETDEMLAFALCFAALYLWLELKLGTFAALRILGGTSALLAGVLFAVAFLRASRKLRARAEDALRAAADPVQASTAAIARAADQAVNGAADIVRPRKLPLQRNSLVNGLAKR